MILWSILTITSTMMKLPKVLVGTPTFDGKNYCYEEWIKNVKEFTYPNYDIFIADNSQSRDNYERIKQDKQITAKYVTDHTNRTSIMKRIADSHNAVRQHALDNGYDFLLHLESDVFPPKNAIQELLAFNTKAIGATYDIYDADERQIMVRIAENDYSENTIISNGDKIDRHLDGKIKLVWSVGLGCNLLHKSVLEKVKFRHQFIDDKPIPSDTLFSWDLRENGIAQYWHSGVYCEHKNKAWVNYGADFLKTI
jgi:GT2 family glycosyltransferase